MGGGFHHSSFQADWIEIFNNFNKKKQPALTGHGFTTVMLSIKFSKLHKQGDIQLLISTASSYSDYYESMKSDKVAQLNRYSR